MKKCRGTGKALGSGCESLIERAFKYGMCKPCYSEWLFGTDEGRKKLNWVKSKAHAEANEKKQKAISDLYRQPRKSKKTIEDMSFRELKIATQKACNLYIRTRDEINYGMCISSGNKIDDAGHFFSIGSNEALRYSPQNIHGQNRGDNFFKSGNMPEYEKGLRLRFGDPYMDDLYELNAETMSKKILDRDIVLRINKLYKYLLKKNIWIYTHLEFENYLKIMTL